MVRPEDGKQTVGFGIGNSKRALIASLSLLEGDFDLVHFIIIELTEPTRYSMSLIILSFPSFLLCLLKQYKEHAP